MNLLQVHADLNSAGECQCNTGGEFFCVLCSNNWDSKSISVREQQRRQKDNVVSSSNLHQEEMVYSKIYHTQVPNLSTSRNYEHCSW